MDSDSGDVEVEMMDIIPSAPSLSLSEDDDPGEGDSESLLLPEKDEQKNKNLERGGSTMVDEDEYFGGKGLSAHHEDHEDIIVKVENVHKTYLLGIEGIAALRGVSMSVKRGEFVCIFGTSGGGKTSLLNILGTIDKPTKGSLDICGVHVASKTTDRILADLRLRHIGFVFQTFNLLPALTALENVELPMVLSADLSSSERRERATTLLETVGLSHRLDHVPSQLSGGEQQRVAIARALANEPDILLLDEPTGDLDTVNSALIMKLLVSLNQKKRITLVMVTHDVSIKFFADRIIWLRDGKIQRIEDGTESKKAESLEKLEEKLRDFNQRKEERRQKESEQQQLQQRPAENKKRKLIVRSPQDYKTHPEYVPGSAALTDFTTVIHD